MHPVLRLYEDVLSSADKSEFRLPPTPRFIFVVNGSATIGDHPVSEGEAWQGESAITVKPGAVGVTCWRWEVARGDQGAATANGPGLITHEKLSAFLETMPKGDLLMRGDSVAFPPGGFAYLHRHQGPGIRCLIEGCIRIDTHPVDVVRPWRRVVRIRSGRRVRPSRARQAKPLYSRDDPAARAAGKKLNSVCER
jgi:hypothetical protein